MKILKSVILLFCLGFCTSSQAQDIHYTMFDMAPLELNPAYTGYFAGTFRVGGIYRTQWAGLSISQPPSLNNATKPGGFSGFQTPSAYIDVPFGIPPGKNSKRKGMPMKSWAGVGISFYLDQVGPVSNIAASLSLAYHLGLGEKGRTILSFAVQGGVLQHRISGDLTFEDQLMNTTPGAATTDPLFMSGDASKTIPDFSGGLMLSHRASKFSIEGGLSINHFTNPNYSLQTPQSDDEGEARLPMTIIANVIFKVDLTKRLFLKPLFFFQNMLNTTGVGDGLSAYDLNGQILLGIHFNEMKDITLYLGGGYRVSGDAIARIGLDVKGLKFGFAYDINTQGQGLSYRAFQNTNNVGMAFEVALSYIAKIYKVPVVKDVLFCPRF